MKLVFVYGSLQRGERNHRMMAGAHLLRLAKTVPAFELFDLGSFPAMVACGTGQVLGEVYEVEPDLLDRLDIFEGVPALYERHTIALEDGSEADAYLMRQARLGRARRITNGNWKSWRRTR